MRRKTRDRTCMTSMETYVRACPRCAASYTVGPHVYQLSPEEPDTNVSSSFLPLSVFRIDTPATAAFGLCERIKRMQLRQEKSSPVGTLTDLEFAWAV
jgi:hypothetical protein